MFFEVFFFEIPEFEPILTAGLLKCGTRGKPSTWLPRGKLVEQIFFIFQKIHAVYMCVYRRRKNVLK